MTGKVSCSLAKGVPRCESTTLVLCSLRFIAFITFQKQIDLPFLLRFLSISSIFSSDGVSVLLGTTQAALATVIPNRPLPSRPIALPLEFQHCAVVNQALW